MVEVKGGCTCDEGGGATAGCDPFEQGLKTVDGLTGQLCQPRAIRVDGPQTLTCRHEKPRAVWRKLPLEDLWSRGQLGWTDLGRSRRGRWPGRLGLRGCGRLGGGYGGEGGGGSHPAQRNRRGHG